MPRTNLFILCLTVIGAILCAQRATHNLYGHYFAEAFDEVERRALEQPGADALFVGAMRGLVDQLDEYSEFIPIDKADAFRSDLDQKFVGVGVEVTRDPETGKLTVGNTVIGKPSPAWDAGLRADDEIVGIGGESTAGWTLDRAVAAIRGPAGDPVNIEVQRPGESTTRKLTVTRSRIDVDSVVGDYRGADKQWVYLLRADPRIAYVRLKTFGDHTAQELRTALTALKQRGELHALILDVRDNVGGYLNAATDVADLFIERGVIVTTRGRDGEVQQTVQAKPSATLTDVPMVVLINKESASASEVLAAALQDHGRATLIGTRTWGKGSVQQMIPLQEGRSILKLTTSSFWRPSGRNIHRLSTDSPDDEWGVSPEPSDVVELSASEEETRRKTRHDLDVFRSDAPPRDEARSLSHDPQLRRAVEYLERQLAQAPASSAA